MIAGYSESQYRVFMRNAAGMQTSRSGILGLLHGSFS